MHKAPVDMNLAFMGTTSSRAGAEELGEVWSRERKVAGEMGHRVVTQTTRKS